MHSDILQLLSHLSLERRAFHSSVSPRIGSPEGLRSAAQRLAHCVGMCVPGLIWVAFQSLAAPWNTMNISQIYGTHVQAMNNRLVPSSKVFLVKDNLFFCGEDLSHLTSSLIKQAYPSCVWGFGWKPLILQWFQHNPAMYWTSVSHIVSVGTWPTEIP